MILLIGALVLAVFNVTRHAMVSDWSWGFWLNAFVVAVVIVILVTNPERGRR